MSWMKRSPSSRRYGASQLWKRATCSDERYATNVVRSSRWNRRNVTRRPASSVKPSSAMTFPSRIKPLWLRALLLFSAAEQEQAETNST